MGAAWVGADFSLEWAWGSYLREEAFIGRRPSLGLAWYIFTEMFERYRGFFVLAFGALRLAVLAPLCEHFLRHPTLRFREKYGWLTGLSLLLNALLHAVPSLLDYSIGVLFLLPAVLANY